jgi:hypothetical protein
MVMEEKIDAKDKAESKSKFPRGVPFILANVLFEKYSGRGTTGELHVSVSVGTSLQASIF